MKDKLFYIQSFNEVADALPATEFVSKQIEMAVGEYYNCPFIKLFKREWANPSANILYSPSRIFFSIWIDMDNDAKLCYNIHALKLRELKGYKIESRKFANLFRAAFKPFEKDWPNVSTEFGPLTLMEGHIILNQDNFNATAYQLAINFLNIAHIIDDTLGAFKR